MTTARIGKKRPPGFSLEVDFPLAAGITAVYGPAGAGKTTIVDALAGFLKPDSGRILLNDVILFDAEARVHVPPPRRGCGHIGAAESLFPHLNVRQNLAFAAHPFSRLERHRRIAEMTERFQLTAVENLRPREIDSAARLRAEVARALLAEPKLLLIDGRNTTESLLAKIRETTAAPILLTTASLDLCCAMADSLILLDAGRIVQQGAPRAILIRPESVEAARLLGIPNVFEATIAALDPARNTSRLEFEHFGLTGTYLAGHLRGDRVWIAIAASDVRVHSAEIRILSNAVATTVVRATPHAQTVRLEFANGVSADLSHAAYAAQKDNKGWQIEIPPEALKAL